MGHWEQEHGQIVLPSAEVSSVKKALRDAHNGHVEKVYDTCKDFWRDNSTQSDDKYRQAVDDLTSRLARGSGRDWRGRNIGDEQLADDVRHVLTRVGRSPGNLRGVTWSDMDEAGLERKTNRDNRFSGGDWSVSIDPDTRTLSYRTAQNRHVIERSRSSPVVQAMFRSLKGIDWTRGSGGTLRGSNEYAVEAAMEHGGQASHIKDWFGPRGAEAYKHETGFYPEGSPQREDEQAKAAKKERNKRKRAAARERKKAEKRKQTRQAAASGAKFCGSPRTSGDGLCGRTLNGGTCPDHGTTSVAMVAADAAATADASAVAAADPFA